MSGKEPNPYQATGHPPPTTKAIHPRRAFLILNVVLVSFIAGIAVIALLMPALTTTEFRTDAPGDPVTMQSTFTISLTLTGMVVGGIAIGLANATLFFYFWVARWIENRN